jgi:hypothetical protein
MTDSTFASLSEMDAVADTLYSYSRPVIVNLFPGLAFTGWKNRHYDVAVDLPPYVDEGFVAQWLYREGKPVRHDLETGKTQFGRNWYVNLPGMQSGEYVAGGTLQIGTERVYADTPKEEIIRLVTEGKAKLIAMLQKEGVQVGNQPSNRP